MPSERWLWISAWPMSRMTALFLARISVIAAVTPGRSVPFILIRMISFFNIFSVMIVIKLGKFSKNVESGLLWGAFSVFLPVAFENWNLEL